MKLCKMKCQSSITVWLYAVANEKKEKENEEERQDLQSDTWQWIAAQNSVKLFTTF